MTKGIAILGSTGSIGTQALDVIARHKDKFSVEVLTANNNADLLIQQAKTFLPDTVVVANTEKYKYLSNALSHLPIKVFAGRDAIAQVVEMQNIDMVLTAMVGFSGLLPTIRAIEAKKDIALANKETLVVAGELINQLVHKNRVQIIPVDSEHSAIFQCLVGETNNPIEKIYLTASGGPFRGKSREFLKNVSKQQALKHPNWNMGAKVTIDSATLMNKGLEAIEAKWLFDLPSEKIQVIIHPQSIIHSLVQFEDSSMKAQMGLPDMKLPILYALSYPKRLKTSFERFSFADFAQLTFEAPDTEKFPNLAIAFDAMKRGGNIPCAMNAANEVAVSAFLNDKIRFTKIPEIIAQTIAKTVFIKAPTPEDYQEIDTQARNIANSLIPNT